MLTYSEFVWKNFLNPTSNLNRFRLSDYRKIFDSYFDKVEIVITKRDEAEFAHARSRILPGFLTGDIAIDSAGLCYVIAALPKV